MLLRPVLSSFVTSDFHEQGRASASWNQLTERTFLQCSVVCVQVAQEAIDTIHKRSHGSGSLAPWWFNVLFLYTAATVLVAARLSSAVLAELPEESIVEGCQKAISALQGYSSFSSAIKRLITTLSLLYDAVPWQYSRLRQNPARLAAEKTSANFAQSHHTRRQNGVAIGAMSDSITNTQQNLPAQSGHEYDLLSPSGLSWDLDYMFDPTDITWLTTLPLDT